MAIFAVLNHSNSLYSEGPAMQVAFLQWLDSTNFDETGQQKIRLSNLTRTLLKHYG
ncbi:MAG TPA: hypothetical protein VIE91_04860 [Methylophilaceae bacterium]|jgi:hypothetical protein